MITDLGQLPDPDIPVLNHTDWHNIILPRFTLKSLKPANPKTVRALDTETLHGYAKLIADDSGDVLYPKNFEDVLKYLTQSKFRSSHNFFFNVQYDFDAIMKYAEVEMLQNLVDKKHVTYGNYKISYIPKKMFKVTHNKHVHAFYDIAQFYEMSLEHAAKKYVGGVKNEDNLDRALIGSSADYWDDHLKEIEKYCIHDAVLTRQLGEKLQYDVVAATGVLPKKFVSKAGLSKMYFRSVCDVPSFCEIPKTVQYYAYQSYHGGRFEVFERGRIGHCTNIDIKSAYPFQISQLVDIRKGKWKRVTDLHESAHYGFYLATVDLPYQRMPPLAIHWFHNNIYPCGTWSAFFTKEELEAVGKVGSYEVISGFEFYPDVLVYPFKEAVLKLYDKKATTAKTDYQYMLYKTILNSFYGVTYEKYKQLDGKMRAGQLFNPIYATLITANTRLQLWHKALEFGDRVVSLATDSVTVRGKIKEESEDFLGGWEKDKEGDTYILRSGIYSIGDELKQRGVIKSRFFRTPYGNYENLFDYIKDYPDWQKYPVLNNRPIHMTEAIRHSKKHTKDDINIFVDTEMAFDLNTEVKRIFAETELTGKDLLTKRITSEPYVFYDL